MPDINPKTLSELSLKAEQHKKETKEQLRQSCYVPIIENILSDNAFDINRVATQGGFCHQFFVNSHQLKNIDDLNDFVKFTKTYLMETKGYKECKIIRTFDIGTLAGLLVLVLIMSTMILSLSYLISQAISITQNSNWDFGFFIFAVIFVFSTILVMFYSTFYPNYVTGNPLNPLTAITPKKPLSIYLAWR